MTSPTHNTPWTPTATRRWLMLIATMIAAMTTTIVVNGMGFLIPTFHTANHIPLSTLAIIAACPTVGLMLTMIGWGAVIDRVGERRVLIISLTLSIVITGLLTVVGATRQPIWAFGVALFLAGMTVGSMNSASGRVVAGWFPAHQRGLAMGVRQMAQPLGIAVSSMSMPFVASSLGAGWGFVVASAVAGAALIMVTVIVVDPIRPERARASSHLTNNPYRRDTFLTRVHIISALLTIPQIMLWVWVPTWLQLEQHFEPTVIAIIITVTQLCGALGRVGAGIWSDRVGSRMGPVRIIAIAASISLATLAFLDWLHSPAAVVAMVCASIITVSDNGLSFTAIAEVAGPFWSGRSLAVQNTGQFAASSVTTWLFGTLIESSGFIATFGIAALIPIAAAVVIPNDRRRLELTESHHI